MTTNLQLGMGISLMKKWDRSGSLKIGETPTSATTPEPLTPAENNPPDHAGVGGPIRSSFGKLVQLLQQALVRPGQYTKDQLLGYVVGSWTL